ncbi:TerC family protein [Mariluticola halotolerans]|uniref:TerC family protein n=1 Tax=Mariluticola halotolerans TaxID=2909283 RepID=UPI0026E13DC6|nr:TerC family protein [Mariluticola halotolerans]UJQ95461.1 TerC family protein [Mariluticola halotolerans]
MEFFSDPGALGAFFSVVMIDLVLAGDNAVVIGLAAAGLPAEMRRKAVLFGILAATVLRIGLAVVAVQLLAIVGLLLAGGLLLLWVCWKMWVEIRDQRAHEIMAQEALEDTDLNADGRVGAPVKTKSFKHAITQIVVADVSMSLDNVLAVAGAARDHTEALIFGLGLSIVLMGFAAAFIAKLLNRYHWLAYLGLGIVLIVALRMIWHGGEEILHQF